MNGQKVLLASLLLVATYGVLTINVLTMNVMAQVYDFDYENDHYKVYPDYKKGTSADVNIQKIKCVNSNVNVNGIDITQIPTDDLATAEATNEAGAANQQDGTNGNGLADRINVERNLVNVCANINSNDQTKIELPETATLTVKKEIFGCDSIEGSSMECDSLVDNSPLWLACANSAISGTTFCQNLPANLFDIQVLDDQNTQIQQFEGFAQGTTIQNLPSGTYTVNEIKHQNHDNQLGESDAEDECKSSGFEDAGLLINTNVVIGYQICFKYEDEQGNDCSTLTLQPGEDKTCVVKNYIRNGQQGGT